MPSTEGPCPKFEPTDTNGKTTNRDDTISRGTQGYLRATAQWEPAPLGAGVPGAVMSLYIHDQLTSVIDQQLANPAKHAL